MVVNKADSKIICISFANGRRHDFRLFKELKLKMYPKIRAVVVWGILELQSFTQILMFK
jgi:hypothetical protein